MGVVSEENQHCLAWPLPQGRLLQFLQATRVNEKAKTTMGREAKSLGVGCLSIRGRKATSVVGGKATSTAKTHQHLGAQYTQLHQGLPTWPCTNPSDPILSKLMLSLYFNTV